MEQLREIYPGEETLELKQNDSDNVFEVSASAGLAMLGIFKQAIVHRRSNNPLQRSREQKTRRSGSSLSWKAVVSR